MLIKVVLVERVPFERRLEEVEKVSHVAFWGKASQPERTAKTLVGKCLVCLKNSKDGSVAGAGGTGMGDEDRGTDGSPITRGPGQ